MYRIRQHWSAAFLCLPIVCSLAQPAMAHPGLHHDIERVTDTLSAQPDRVDLLLRRAQLYVLDSNPSAALIDLERVSRLAGPVPEVALQRGLALSALGRDTEAEADFDAYIESGGLAVVAWSERARIRERSGRLESAVSDYDEILRHHPLVELYLSRGRLLESLKRLDEAAHGYREAMARLGESAQVRSALIRVETLQGNYDAALLLIDEVIDNSPIKTDWYLQRADVLDSAGKSIAAIKAREKALAQSNRALVRRRSALNLCGRARVLLALDRREEAAADLAEALKLAPKYPTARDMMQAIEAINASNTRGK